MKQKLAIATLLAAGAFAQETLKLTPAQEATFQKSSAAFYYQAAVANGMAADLERARSLQERLRLQMIAACPGELVDLDGKPSECKLKAPEVSAKDDTKK